MQPNVRDLQALIAEQQQAVAPQQMLLDQDIQRNDTSGAAQVAGLDASKKQAFGEIEQAAQNKGMFFSGFSPDQQAKYTGGTYLTALAQLQSTIANTRSNIMGKKADLNTDVFKSATGMRENDIATLASWNKMTAEQQFSASQADKDRVFRAQQAEADRRAATSNAAAGRAASASNAPTPVQMASAEMGKKVGKDGYVSPGTYSANKQIWIASGYGNGGQFDQIFGGFRNPKDPNYRLG